MSPWGVKRSSVRGQKGTRTIITRCFDIDMTAVSLPGPPFETWFGGRNPSYALRAHRCWSASRLGLAQVPTGDPGAAKEGLSAVETRQARQHHGPPTGQMQL